MFLSCLSPRSTKFSASRSRTCRWACSEAQPPPRSQTPSQPRGDIDALAHKVAVALLDDVAEMNADAKLDALVRCDARVAIDHSALDLDPAAHSVDHATELNDT